MVGVTSVGVYIPAYRLSRDEIAKTWGARSPGGEKAVAGYDEDSITMAAAAAIDCMKENEAEADGLFFATTTAPYKEKQSAAIIASAVDMGRETRTADFTGSLRAATIAINSAIDAVKSSSAKNIIVTASDCRIGAAQGDFEHQLGDGAAALMIGGIDVVASIEGSYSIFDEFTDLWRAEGDTFIHSAEPRFINTEGYIRTVQEAASGLMRKYELTPKDFSKAVFYCPDIRSHANLAKNLGFDLKTQVQEPLSIAIGNTGAAASVMMLASALEEAKPGDKILFASYGNGSDAFLLKVTEDIDRIQRRSSMKRCLARKTPIDYAKYASWRNLISMEASRLPQDSEPSLPCLWRERKSILALYGVKCRQCGTPQYPPGRVCVVCQAKDNFDDYRFSDKRGKVFTYAIDRLAPTKNPPAVNGVIDFDGGGRMICDITDCEPDEVKIGMPVEMTFRRFSQGGGIANYFWKAIPATS